MLEPADIPGVRKKYAKGMGISEKTVWRHNPLDGIGYRREDRSHVYNTCPTDGLIEPHVFARFQRVTFHADFDFTAAESHLHIDNEFNIDTDDRARFIAFLRRAGIFELLVRLLSNSPSLHRLSIGLNVQVWANYDPDDSDEEMDLKKIGAANERAADIFMDGGILHPLQKISNVKSFEFVFDIMTYDCHNYQPQPRHVETIQELQRIIERNWQVEQESKQCHPRCRGKRHLKLQDETSFKPLR